MPRVNAILQASKNSGMKRTLMLLLAGLCGVGFAFAQRSDCSVYPYPNKRTQPDGQSLTLTAVGTEMVHYLETNDGHTVLEAADGFYKYAILDQSGNMVASDINAYDNTKTLSKNLPALHLRYSALQQQI